MEPKCLGSSIFKVAYKIKRCRMELIKWNKQQESNSAIRIHKLKEEIVEMKETEGQRNWEKWNTLKN